MSACDDRRAAKAEGFNGYRRRVLILPGPGVAIAALEDDFHHFEVTVLHDGKIITDVKTTSHRYPWSTCWDAGPHLDGRMRGVPLAVAKKIEDQRQHCTHIYDLFILAVDHACDSGPCRYDIRVADPVSGTALAELDLNGSVLLKWRRGGQQENDGIPGGDMEAMSRWSKGLPADLREPARMLRRGVLVSQGRPYGSSEATRASEMKREAVCFSYQPHRAQSGLRMPEIARDFSGSAEIRLLEKYR